MHNNGNIYINSDAAKSASVAPQQGNLTESISLVYDQVIQLKNHSDEVYSELFGPKAEINNAKAPSSNSVYAGRAPTAQAQLDQIVEMINEINHFVSTVYARI